MQQYAKLGLLFIVLDFGQAQGWIFQSSGLSTSAKSLGYSVDEQPLMPEEQPVDVSLYESGQLRDQNFSDKLVPPIFHCCYDGNSRTMCVFFLLYTNCA